MPGQTDVAVRFFVDHSVYDQQFARTRARVSELVAKIRRLTYLGSADHQLDVWQNEGGR